MNVLPSTNQRSSMLRRRQSIETNISTGTTTSSDLMAILRDIPKMELLPISYAGRKSNPTPDTSKPHPIGQSFSNNPRFDNIIAFKKQVLRKSQTPIPIAAQKPPVPPVKTSYNPLKYVVYKKHNQVVDPKLQYLNDASLSSSAAKSLPKKRFFENDRKSKTKFDTIQFVFDNKDYERHVDNKMYDCVGPEVKEDSGDRCNSWQYRRHPHLVSRPARTRDTKIEPLRQKFSQTKSAPAAIVNDATRIRQMFDNQRPLRTAECVDETAGSLKKVKKLVDNFENRCSCKEEKSLPPVPKQRLPPGTIHRKGTRKSAIASSTDVRSIFDESLGNVVEKVIIPDPKEAIKKLDDLTSDIRHQTCGYTSCSLPNCPVSFPCASESSSWYYNGDRCQSPSSQSTDTILASEDSIKISIKSNDLPCGLPTAESIKNLKNLKDIKSISDKFTKSGLNINNPVANKHIHKDEFNVVRHLNKKLSNLTISLPMDDIQKTPTKSISTLFLNHSTQEESSTDSSTDMGYFGSIVASDASEISSASSTSSASSLCKNSSLLNHSQRPTTIESHQRSRLPVSVTSSKLHHHHQAIDNQLKSTSQRMSRLFPSRHGCDGAIFWNDCYYYDDEPVVLIGISSKFKEPDCCNELTSNSICSFDLDQVGLSCWSLVTGFE